MVLSGRAFCNAKTDPIQTQSQLYIDTTIPPDENRQAQKLQVEVERSTDELRGLEGRYNEDIVPKFNSAKSAYEVQLQQKQILQNQIAENRKLKQTLQKVGSGFVDKNS